MNEEAVIQSNIAEFNYRLVQYQNLSGKVPGQVLREKSARLGYILKENLKNLIPPQGYITDERLEALKEGRGVRISKVAMSYIADKYKAQKHSGRTWMVVMSGKKHRGKNESYFSPMVPDPKTGKLLNVQALRVQFELSLRESGRGFLSRSSDFHQSRYISGNKAVAFNRHGEALGEVDLEMSITNESATLRWGGGLSNYSNEIAIAMEKPKAQSIIADSIRYISEDMKVYIDRKNRENMQKSFYES